MQESRDAPTRLGADYQLADNRCLTIGRFYRLIQKNLFAVLFKLFV